MKKFLALIVVAGSLTACGGDSTTETTADSSTNNITVDTSNTMTDTSRSMMDTSSSMMDTTGGGAMSSDTASRMR
ncbi:hypothetical protein EXU57_05815 [Segetibacter sp. 3557_3]|uniref:hypothetical protein n=1 Tax=Segetibacter sp. 3557_3 TaxID=2547429 RepID=UPI00105886B3|nr:hypothetical protein [Segetibacter sp. 3557_3]TDH27980.1 hypothetical protein EXU57_05815 [Segetibacter sp. 3557_3]